MVPNILALYQGSAQIILKQRLTWMCPKGAGKLDFQKLTENIGSPDTAGGENKGCQMSTYRGVHLQDGIFIFRLEVSLFLLSLQ